MTRDRTTRGSTTSGTILTLGGGGFSMPAEAGAPDGSDSALDDLLLSLVATPRGAGGLPRVCFVPTASGDSADYVARFHAAFAGRAETSTLELFGLGSLGGRSVREHVLDQDVVYVGGGSTLNLLALWRLHGLDAVLREALAAGVVVAGISAGMNCWFEGCSTDSCGTLAPLADGLGLLPGSACPHYDGEAERERSYRSFVASGALPAGWALDDGVALLWRDGELVEAVSERPGGRAFRTRVRPDGAGGAVEEPLAVRLLGP
ncbi:peptidase E [Nocardioides sp. zg-DK7169]|uniref:Type 1 glutamine amidotransferase-like domain-containing protein n=1 Tax=Nocardioides sp. zg-DK7169 TaxID=2736600 RepID=UPI00155546AC|nr:peptidase E [Nocardioides sp. zg-DK7169]NPC97099.1 peptidase E [Nocardioides sp. zg-DK7169]